MIQLEVLQSLTNAFPPQRTAVPDPGPDGQDQMGFFTDTSLCIGCKACEVACKQWNQLPSDGYKFTGNSYDNTEMLSATTWRHVAFQEQIGETSSRWLMMSDVCKHCVDAPCVQSCPTGALIYNEFGNVYVQDDICNGCGYCISACPFGVIGARLGRRPRAQMHALLRPADGGADARLRQSLSDGFDPIRPRGQAARTRP